MTNNKNLLVKIMFNGYEIARLYEDESKKLDKVLANLGIKSLDDLFIVFGDERDSEGLLYSNSLLGVVMGKHLEDKCMSKYHITGSEMVRLINGDMNIRQKAEKYFDEDDSDFDNMYLLVMKFGKLVPKQVVDF